MNDSTPKAIHLTQQSKRCKENHLREQTGHREEVALSGNQHVQSDTHQTEITQKYGQGYRDYYQMEM